MSDRDGEMARELSSAKCTLEGSWMISCVNLVGEASVIVITTAAVAIPSPTDRGLIISNSGSDGGFPE